MSSREKETLLKVMELYKEMRFLWDKKHKDYNNRECRNNGYSILLEAYKEFDSKGTVKALTKKLQNLRTTYYKELKKVQDSKQSGGNYVPTLWYYNAFSFMEGISESNRPVEDFSSCSSYTECENPNRNYKIDTNEFTRRSKKRKRRLDYLKDNDNCVTMKDEDWEIMGKSITLQMKDLNKKELAITQKLISDVIYYAKIGLLSEHSFVSVGLDSHNAPFATTSNSTYGYSSNNKQPQQSIQSPDSASSSSPKYYIDCDTASSNGLSPNHTQISNSDPITLEFQSSHIEPSQMSSQIQPALIKSEPFQFEKISSNNQ